MLPTEPRAFRDPSAINARRASLNEPHILPLTTYVRELRGEGRGNVPDFDPLDGGVNAAILFLMEKPGPMTDDMALSGRVGSGFVSRDNDDATAAAIFSFMAEAGIERQDSILWNTIPWWNGTRSIKKDELAAGVERLDELLKLLPNLAAVVGVGSKAQSAERLLTSRGLPFIRSAHPSPINRASRPALWASIPNQWSEARQYAPT